MRDIGMRVGAIFSANPAKKLVEFLGYGQYLGDIEHPDIKRPNPKIQLDNGKVVWGCECWWGPEEQVRSRLDNYTNQGCEVVEVDMDKKKAEMLAAHPE